MIRFRSIHTLFRCLILGPVFVPGLALPLDLTINNQGSYGGKSLLIRLTVSVSVSWDLIQNWKPIAWPVRIA